MAFNNMDIDKWKVLFDRCPEQVERDEGDLIIQEVQEENENRVYANIPDLNEPYDDGHGHNTIETPKNDDHNSNANDSIESSVLPQVFISVESSGLPHDLLPQVGVSVENSGSLLPQDNLHVSVESNENDTLTFEKWDDLLNSICEKLKGIGKEEEDTSQELQIIKDQSNLHMDFEVILEEICQWVRDRTGLRLEKQDFQLEVAPEYKENQRRAYYYIHELIYNNSAKKESESDDSIKQESKSDDENNGDDGSQDNLQENNEQNDTLRFEKSDMDDLLNSICEKLKGIGKEEEDTSQELQIIKDQSNLHMDFEVILDEICQWVRDRTGLRLEKQDFQLEVAPEYMENQRRAYYYIHELIYNNSAKKESESDDSIKQESKSDDENNGDGGSQDNLQESNEQNDSIRFEKLDIDQKQKHSLNISQQSEGACPGVEDIIQEFQIIKVPSILGMDIELLKAVPVDQRVENLIKLVQDAEKEIALRDSENKRRADAYLRELLSSSKNSCKEESITEESDEENGSSDGYEEESDEENYSSDDYEESDEENYSSDDYEESDEENYSSDDYEESDEENESVTDEMYYSCDSDPWDVAISDISDDESCIVDMKSESSSGIDGTVESDGTEAPVPLNSPDEIKHGDEMNSNWRNPIIISSSSSDSDADLNTSMESDMEDIHLTDDEFEQTWEFINPKEVQSIPCQQQKERSIKKRILSLFSRKKMAADGEAA